MKHYAKEINHFFVWMGSSTLKRLIKSILTMKYITALVASGLIRRDPFYCLLTIFMYIIVTGKLKLLFFRETHVESSNTQMD